MRNIRGLGATALIAALLAAGCKTTDLAMNDFSVSAPQAAAGEQLVVTAGVVNAGSEPIRSADGITAPVTVDIQLFATASGYGPIAYLTGWGVSSDRPFLPGERVSEPKTIVTPDGLAEGDYTICADVDFQNRIAEKNERNNRLCASLRINAGLALRADLVVDSVTLTDVEKDSQGVIVRVRNVGRAAVTEPFALLALSGSNAEPMYFTSCALSTADRAASGALPCGGVWISSTLAPGAYADVAGFVTAPLTLETGMTTNVIGALPRPRRTVVDIMADGCRAPGEPSPLPSWCRINEANELNNFGSAQMRVR